MSKNKLEKYIPIGRHNPEGGTAPAPRDSTCLFRPIAPAKTY